MALMPPLWRALAQASVALAQRYHQQQRRGGARRCLELCSQGAVGVCSGGGGGGKGERWVGGTRARHVSGEEDALGSNGEETQ